jgi:hypothetical protein
MAKQIAMPINSFTSDFTNIFDIEIDDLDFEDVDIEIGSNIELDEDEINKLSLNEKIMYSFVSEVSNKVKNLRLFLENKKDKFVNNEELKELMNNSLASENITKDPNLEPILEIWDQVNNITYSKEDKFIKTLQENSTEKFNTIKDIINTEILKNNKLRKNFNESYNSGIKKV